LSARRFAHALAAASLLALLALTLAWEASLAPLRPGGSWLVLKALPLAAALPGVLRARLYTLRWTTLLVLAYLAEGVVRAWSERGVGAVLALGEAALALLLFAACIACVRLSAGKSTAAVRSPAR